MSPAAWFGFAAGTLVIVSNEGNGRMCTTLPPVHVAVVGIDKVVPEPIGGAHRDPAAMIASLRKALVDTLKSLSELPIDAVLARRRERLLGYGKFKDSALA